MDALIIVDIQNDFLPGGALAVKEGEKVVPVISKLLDLPFNLKIASKDWHPPDHGSFASTHKKKPGDKVILNGLEQILWPDHCIQGTFGSDFPKEIDRDKFDKIFYKGIEKNIDSYSTFFDNGHLKSTGLDDFLKSKNVTKLYVAGLATDYCVKYSILDASKLGYEIYVVEDGCRGVNLKPTDSQEALDEIRKYAKVIQSDQILLGK
jgi:nicotinamidase/pyrazinamidase